MLAALDNSLQGLVNAFLGTTAFLSVLSVSMAVYAWKHDMLGSILESGLFGDGTTSRGANGAKPRSLETEDVGALSKLLHKHKAVDAEAWKTLAVSAANILLGFVLCQYTSKSSYAAPWYCAEIYLAFALVRCFIVFHDACHGSFFSSRASNKKLAYALSTFVSYTEETWTTNHNQHHNNLGDAGFFDPSLTVWFNQAEYHGMTPLVHWAFRIIRDPFVLPGLLSVWVFFLAPIFLARSWTGTTPASGGALYVVLLRSCFLLPVYLIGGGTAFFNFLVANWIGGIVGIQLFHLQHQCNQGVYRVSSDKVHMTDAGMHGSTFLYVPECLKWATLGIEYHHIHHASTRVPGYNIRACHEEGGQAGLWKRAGVNNVGPKRAFLSLFHTLFWAEKLETKGKPSPYFTTFEPYKAMGLWDDSGQHIIE